MKILFVTLALFCVSANADEWKSYLVINAFSYHFNREAAKELNFNEINPGIGFEFNKNDYGLAIGSYYNSNYRNSNYILGQYIPLNISNVSIGVIAGGITGYSRADIKPSTGLLIVINSKTVSSNIIIIPDIPTFDVYGFIGFQIKFKI